MEQQLSSPPSELDNKLTPMQRANAHLNVARGLHHAYIMLLRTQGLTSKNHPYHQESERLKVYGKKVRKLESAEYLATHKPALELNIGAANRFISHAIPDLSADQKTALKEVSSKRKQADESTGTPAEMARAFLEQTLGSTKAKKSK